MVFSPAVLASDPSPGPGYVQDPDFVAGDTYSFTISCFTGEDPTGEVYTLTGNPLSLRLGDLVAEQIIFSGGDLGRCAFILSNGVVALRTGMQPGGAYGRQFILYDGIPFINENMYLISGNYEAVGLCELDNSHELVRGYYVAPTCTEEGKSGTQCAFCDYVITRPVSALGHDFDFWGRCKRDGCNEVHEIASTVGGWFSGVGDWFSDAGNSIADVGNSIAGVVSDLIDKGKDAFDDGKDAIGEKASSFVTTIAVVAGLSIGIPIAVFIGRFIKWLKNLKK